MIAWLAGLLGIHLPFFTYTTTRMLLAAATALIVTIGIGPAFIRMLYRLKIGQKIRTDEAPHLGELHKNKRDTPTMGGVLMLFSMVLSLVLWMDLSHSFTWLLGLATLVLGGIGALDDWLKIKRGTPRGLIARYKFAAQFLFALAVGLYLLVPSVQALAPLKAPVARQSIEQTSGKRISGSELYREICVPFVKRPLTAPKILIPALIALFILVIAGTSNAVNLTDGLDGLAAGTLLIATIPFVCIAFVSSNSVIASYLNLIYIEGAQEIAIFLSAMIGALVGFLWYNAHPAEIFMGDAGSLPLGGILGLSAVLLRRELLLALVGGVFVLETLSVILQVLSFRYRGGKRLFLCAPIHHHFEYAGMPETRVVIRFWILGLMLAILGLLTLKLQ